MNIPKIENTTVALIYANIAVFILVCIFELLAPYIHIDLSSYLMMPFGFTQFIHRPWTIITYMFTHSSFIHIIFNLICLHSFGQLLTNLLGDQVILKTYIIGGLAGAITCLLFFNLPLLTSESHFSLFTFHSSLLLGASAAILSLLTAATVIAPNQLVHIPFLTDIRLKWYALIFLIIYVLFILGMNNVGGNIAHIGGMIAGFALGRKWKKQGVSPRDNWSRFLPWQRKSHRSTFRVIKNDNNIDHAYNREKVERSREVDRILDKIKESGYNSLTPKEKQTLFDASKEN